MNSSWEQYLGAPELGALRLDDTEVHKFTVLNTRRALVVLVVLFTAMGGVLFAGATSGFSDAAATLLIFAAFIVGLMILAIGDHLCMDTERVRLMDATIDSRLYGKVAFADIIQYRVNDIDAGSYGKSKGLKIWTRGGTIHYNQWIYATAEYEQFASAFVGRIEAYNPGNESGHEVLENDPLAAPWAKAVAIGLIVACLPLPVLAPERVVLFLPVLGGIGGAIFMNSKKGNPAREPSRLRKSKEPLNNNGLSSKPSR